MLYRVAPRGGWSETVSVVPDWHQRLVCNRCSAACGLLAGFISAQRRAQFIRRTLNDGQAPIEFAAAQLVDYFLDPLAQRDPIIAAWNNLKVTRDRLAASPNSIQLARQLEARHRAYVKAQAKSPATKLVLFIRAHNALVARANGPATLEEALALVNELNALIALLEA